VKHESSNT